ncbi:MAG TPA: DNA recombination protein RmuC [Novosphingobium sp.]|nr:DNA recombination protein RmuC [Novosphingobium sp.]
MNSLLPVFCVILGLAAGLALGWFLWARGVAEWRLRAETREREGRETEERFRAAIRDLAAMSERAARADDLARDLAQAAAQREDLRAQLAKFQANAAHFEEQQRLLLESQARLQAEFERAGARVLEQAQESFLARAEARFAESEKTNAERIHTVLAPVSERLHRYEEQVQALEARRVDAFGQLLGQIEQMRAGQEAVRAEAMRLGNSLRNAPKARGRWGEQQLRNVLEQCGLSEHTDFVTEQSVETDDGRLRPDAIVNIPGRKQLVIDAKVSLNAYQEAFEAQDEGARDLALKAHVASMRAHIQTLAGKSYQSQFEAAPDYVLMFVPGEHFIAAALEYDRDIWNFAFERKVLLASPTNLVAIARTVAQVWHQVGLEKEAREIGALGASLYDSLAKTQDDMMKMGTHLGRAVNSFNDFARTYDGHVMSRARRLAEKHIKIGKREIGEEVPLVETAPRYGDPAAEPALALPAQE